MDELLSRRAPHSAEAEQAVIGSLLIDPRCVPDVLAIIKSADFYVQPNREIFETVYHMFLYSMAIDAVTVLDQMRVLGVYREESSAAYMGELMRVTPTAANVLEYAAIVRDRALLRSLMDAADEISRMVMEGVGEADAILEAAEKKIYAIRQGRSTGGLTPISEIMMDVYSNLSELAKNGGTMPGLPTGFGDLDKRLLGLGPGELIFIASRPGMGKTSIAMNIAAHVGKNSGKAVAIFSLEMSREQLALRLLSAESNIDGKKLSTGLLNQHEWREVGSASSRISATDMLIDDNPSLSVADMNAQCRRVRNLGLVVIDYLQLMQSAGSNQRYNENRQQAVSEMSRMLKIMAKELNVPIICMSQLSRANEARQNKRPQLSDLRESGSIEQDADVVIGLYREGYYDEEVEHPNEAEAIVLKNRQGETGKIALQWVPETTTFKPSTFRHEE